jgi:chemotaxis protein methyltransferase CheR
LNQRQKKWTGAGAGMHGTKPSNTSALSNTVSTTQATPHEHEREFLFTDQDFERIRTLIYQRAGIALSPIKRDMVYSRLARRLRATGIRTFAEYVHYVEQGHPSEMEAFTNSLTTNLTSFFREDHHFELLREFLRPRLSKDTISIWCAAASTGEEPYSIAMTIAELFGSIPHHIKIIASDLDTNVLEKARLGIYTHERLAKVPEALRKKYFFSATHLPEGHAQVRPELQAMLIFRQINLLDATWPMRGPFDVIFCRNVMIYFDKATQYHILEKFVPYLAPDGLLFAGHSESFHHAANLFKLRGKTVYALAENALPRACQSERR